MSAAVKNFVFADKTKFFELADGPDSDTGLPTIVLPAGAELYRADHAGAKEPGADVPAFFTNRGSTAAYTRGAKGALSQYVVKKEARLFHMTLNSIFRLMPLLANRDDIEVLMTYFDPEEAVVNPSGFTPKNLATYRANTSKFPNYLNRRMAEIICRLGFDGWVVKPYNEGKRTGLAQLSYYKDSDKVKTRIVAYTPEIMLCRWKEILDLKYLAVPNNAPAPVAGKARRRRRTRKAQR